MCMGSFDLSRVCNEIGMSGHINVQNNRESQVLIFYKFGLEKMKIYYIKFIKNARPASCIKNYHYLILNGKNNFFKYRITELGAGIFMIYRSF